MLQLPTAPDEVLSIPKEDIPNTLRALISRGELSGLMRRINAGVTSRDPDQQRIAHAVLERLGFPE